MSVNHLDIQFDDSVIWIVYSLRLDKVFVHMLIINYYIFNVNIYLCLFYV